MAEPGRGGDVERKKKKKKRSSEEDGTLQKRKRSSSDAPAADLQPTVKKVKRTKEEKERRKEKKKARKKEKKKEKGKKEEPDSSAMEVDEGDGSENGSSDSVIQHLYHQHQDVTKAGKKDVAAFRTEKNIYLSKARTVEDEEEERRNTERVMQNKLWNPIREFSQVEPSVGAKLLKVSCGTFERPSPIQSQSWPILLAGRDAVAVAATGSGKTLAFLLPAIKHILANGGAKRNRQPRVLVLSPTRELAMQSFDVATVAGGAVGLKSICLYGGVPKYEQRRAIRAGVQLVVATPGRLLDLCSEESCSLSSVDFVILDEGDRMLDMGFEPDVKRIMALVKPRKERQTVMFSATWPFSVQELASSFLKGDAVKICIAREGGSLDFDAPQANTSITQHVELIDERNKEQRLIELLRKYHKGGNRVLVFCLYKKEAARVLRLLQRKGFSKACGIHGDMNQGARSEALMSFKNGSNPILVATDVAARGLDIPDVEFVLNVTFPLTIEDYVHRIGRTGRGGKTGVSHTLFTVGEKKLAGDLVEVLKDAGQVVPPEIEKFGPTIRRKKEHSMYGAHFRAADNGKPLKAATRVVFDDDSD